jgi:hypothetical protein
MEINKVHMEVIKMSKGGYGLGRFIIDLFLISMTGGLWLLWILLRYLRRNSK